MIQDFVKLWERHKTELRRAFVASQPESYREVVTEVVRHVLSRGVVPHPDPDRVHEINDGEYQGTLVYVVAAAGYQPSTYWAVTVSYGSCSGCDALQDLLYRGVDERVDGLMTLALHIVQEFREI
jgi:hypothetical protein